ncbi:MAG: acyltransferase family protein [Firmicutes bacterium]|nr:acyltransferase family protein [Bacillota bacterium]
MEKREFAVDAVKAFAIISVVLIHTCAAGYAYEVGSFNWVAAVFWGSISRAGVPLFFMCSGALLLDPQHDFSVKKLFSKNLLRLCAALFFWAAIYKCSHLLAAGSFTAEELRQALTELALFRHEQHLYFLHIMLLVYLFLPVTRVFVKHADDSRLRYFLAAWFLLGIVYPTVRPYRPFSLLAGIPLQWQMNMTYAAIGYGVLGYYLFTHHFRRKLYPIITGTSGFALVFAGTWIMSEKQIQLYQHFYEGMSVGVCLLAVGVFSFIMRQHKASLPRTLTGLTEFLAKASFCIYLAHLLIIQLFGYIGLRVTDFSCAVSIPALALLNICICSLVYLALSKIPFINKWLI